MSSQMDGSGNKQLTQLERDQIPIENSFLDGIIIFNKTTNQLERLRDRAWHPLIGDSGSFSGLSDTPSGYPGGTAGFVPQVNATENGLVFADPSSYTNTHTIQVGDSSAKVFNVVHPLNTKYVQVSILETITGHKVEADIHVVSQNNVRIEFSIAPNINEFTVVITK